MTRPSFRERCEAESTRDVVFLFQWRKLFWSGVFPDGWSPDCDGHLAPDEDNHDDAYKSMLQCFNEDLQAGDYDTPVVFGEWVTEGVYLSREEAEKHGNARHYNYPDGWRAYGIPSNGELAQLIKTT